MIVHSIQNIFPPVFLQPSTLANSFSRIELSSTILQLHTYSYKPCYLKKIKSPNHYFTSQIERDEYKTGRTFP